MASKKVASKINSKEKEDMLAGSNTFLHPKSRKCVQMIKKVRKDSKKEQHKKDYKLKQSLIAEKLLWFQKHQDSNICPYTVDQTAVLVENYIARNDEELEQIKIKRSIGGNRNKQHIGREDAICMTKEREISDYKSCGLEIPNILNKNQCEMLSNWKGDLKFLPNFKLTRFRLSQVSKVSVEKDSSEDNNKNVSKVIKDVTNNGNQSSSKIAEDTMDTE